VPTDDFRTLEKRVVKLERQNRVWKAASLLLLLAIAMFISLGLAEDDPLVITPARALRAQSFLLTDSNGNVHGRWILRDNKPVLQFYSAEGKVMWSAPPELHAHELSAER